MRADGVRMVVNHRLWSRCGGSRRRGRAVPAPLAARSGYLDKAEVAVLIEWRGKCQAADTVIAVVDEQSGGVVGLVAQVLLAAAGARNPSFTGLIEALALGVPLTARATGHTAERAGTGRRPGSRPRFG